MAGLFIDVEVADEIRDDAEMAQKLADACPVDIYANKSGKVEVVDENLDECILCELCVQAAPPGARRGKKVYDGPAPARERGAVRSCSVEGYIFVARRATVVAWR